MTRTEFICPVDERRPEVARVVELDRRLAARVRLARDDSAFPLVLAGACNSSLGTVAGLDAHALGAVWIDAHADFDTPDDTVSGFFDVMGLAMLTGTGWTALRRTIPGLRVIEEHRVALVAVRALEDYQRERVESSGLHVVPDAVDEHVLAQALDAVRGHGAEAVYLHLDLDSLDTSVGIANEYAAPGGPTLEVLLRTVDAVFDRFTIAAAALTAYDPRLDAQGSVADAARTLARRIAERVRDQSASA